MIRRRSLAAGVAVGLLLFFGFLAILLLAGDLSSSRFIYVDF